MGCTTTLSVTKSMRIGFLKVLYFQKQNVPPQSIRFIFSGVELKNEDTLQQSGLTKESSIHLVIRFSNGSDSPEEFITKYQSDISLSNDEEEFQVYIKTLTSDVRLKKDLIKIEEIKNIKVYKWTWNEIAEKEYLLFGKEEGVLAQEVKEIVQDSVLLNSNGHYEVDYLKIYKYLV